MLKLAFQYGRYVWNRGARHLFSRYRWVILLKPISSDRPGAGEPAASGRYRRADQADYDSLIAIYPSEFAGHLPDNIKRKQLLTRARKELPCFVAEADDGTLVGATWCLPYQDPLLDHSPFAHGRVFEMVNTFVVAEFRGKGIGQALRRHAIRSMASLGYEAVISFVWYSRQQSLNMNLRTGSKVFGDKSLGVLLGTRKQRVGPVVRLDRLPLGELPSLVLVGSSSTVFHRLVQQFRNYGIGVRPIELTAGPEGKTTFTGGMGIGASLIHEAEQCKVQPILFCCDSAACNAVAPFYSLLKKHYIFLTNPIDDVCEPRNHPAPPAGRAEPGTSGVITSSQETLIGAVLDTVGSWLAGFVFLLEAESGDSEFISLSTMEDPELLNKAKLYLDSRTLAGPVVLRRGPCGELAEQLMAEIPVDWGELVLLAEMSNMSWCALLYLNAVGKGHTITCWNATPTKYVTDKRWQKSPARTEINGL